MTLERSSLTIALVAAWTAMLGSLYFSEVAHFIPCTLCWYQRILMYPLALILLVATLRRDDNVPFYVLPLSLLGIGFSTYHYLLQKTTLFSHAAACTSESPCTTTWINVFGFVTIPFLALVAFAVISLAMLLVLTGEGLDDDEYDDEYDELEIE